MSEAEPWVGKEYIAGSGTYVVEKKLGCGTYGTVFKVRRRDDASIVKALKTFDPDVMDRMEGIPPTTIRELNALKAMKPHPSVIKIDEIVYPRNGNQEDMFYTMELCQGSLKDKHQNMIHKYLSELNADWTSPEAKKVLCKEYVCECKLIVWQLLNGVAFSHSWGVAHRDLKPANVMWDFEDNIKIGDFGLARFVRGTSNSAGDDGVAPQTGEVQTLWYRAPEVLLGEEKYGAIVDDWSIGCIMAELFRLRRCHPRHTHTQGRTQRRWEADPLFRGDCEVQTLLMILEARGTPMINTKDYSYVHNLPYWSDRLPHILKPRLYELVPLIDELGLDLLERLLCIHPCRRTAARFLLDHPWFHDAGDMIKERYKLWNDDPHVRNMYTILKEAQKMEPAKCLSGNPTHTHSENKKRRKVEDENTHTNTLTEDQNKTTQNNTHTLKDKTASAAANEKENKKKEPKSEAENVTRYNKRKRNKE